MQVNVSSPNSFTRELKIKVPWEELQDDFNKAAKSFSKRIKMPGFRPGKVPVKKLMSMYLSDIEAHFIDSHLNDYYLKALQQENSPNGGRRRKNRRFCDCRLPETG